MNALISISDVKNYIDVLATDTTYDTILTTLVSVASETIERYCNQPIASTLTTENFIGNGIASKYLDYFPVNSINAIQYQTDVGEDWVDVDTSEYELYNINRGYYIENSGGFSSLYRYRAGLNVGYSTIPYDVQNVAIEMCAVSYNESAINGGMRLGIESMTDNRINIVATTKYLDMNSRWKRVLDSYRKITI